MVRHSQVHTLIGVSALLVLMGSSCMDGSMGARVLDGESSDQMVPGTGSGGGTGTPGEPGGPGEPGEPGQPGEPGGEVEPGGVVSGRVTIRRLNRAEYNNTVKDLLFTDATPADAFPADDFGYGFNNIGDTLTISPLHVELYEQAADELVEEALKPAIDPFKDFHEGESLTGSVGAANSTSWNLWSNGELLVSKDLPADGKYIIRARAWASQSGDDLARMGFMVNSNQVHEVEVAATSGSPEVYEFTATVTAGTKYLGVSFLNDYLDSAAGTDRNLYVDWIEIEGPIDASPDQSAARERIMVCTEESQACARDIFETFAKRAWRRPVTTEEVDRLTQFLGVAAAQELTFEDGIRLGIKAILLSPHFIFKPELDQAAVGQTHLVSAHELATRLSYFLWSSTPDDTLLELADSGEILKDDVLRQQVVRMLEDEKAQALLDNFVTQWLYTDAVLEAQPDYVLFPEYNEELAVAMRQEARMFASDFILDDRDFRELLTADYSYINGTLAAHYEIPGVTGDDFVKHTFDGDERGGILSQGGLLTARSYPNRTSPVLRGVWVLEELLCSAPPPPPANVESIDDQMATEGLTLRERLELHRDSGASCYSCHKIMDPIGFAMEHYDPTGKWRDMDNGKPVDALGELPDGRTFLGARELADTLAGDPLYSECLAEKMLTYATGRGFDVRTPGATVNNGVDAPQVELVADALVQNDYSSRELIMQVVLSDAFRKRTPEPR